MNNDPGVKLGSNIIYNWYIEFEQLFQYYSEYITLLIQAGKNAEDVDNDLILNASNNMRRIVIQNYLRSITIFKSLDVEPTKELEEAYKNVSGKTKDTTIIIRSDIIEKYIIEVQALILKKNLDNIINTSANIMEEVYGNATPISSTDNNNRE